MTTATAVPAFAITERSGEKAVIRAPQDHDQYEQRSHQERDAGCCLRSLSAMLSPLRRLLPTTAAKRLHRAVQLHEIPPQQEPTLGAVRLLVQVPGYDGTEGGCT